MEISLLKENILNLNINENSTKEKKNTLFSDELTQFQDKNRSSDYSQKEDKTAKELVADIISLLRTGLTEEELEAIEKAIKEINKKIKELKEKEEAGNISTKKLKEKIDELLLKLKQMMLAIKKKLTGEAIMEENHNKSVKAMSINELQNIVDKMSEFISDVRAGNIDKEYDNDSIINKDPQEIKKSINEKMNFLNDLNIEGFKKDYKPITVQEKYELMKELKYN